MMRLTTTWRDVIDRLVEALADDEVARPHIKTIKTDIAAAIDSDRERELECAYGSAAALQLWYRYRDRQTADAAGRPPAITWEEWALALAVRMRLDTADAACNRDIEEYAFDATPEDAIESIGLLPSVRIEEAEIEAKVAARIAEIGDRLKGATARAVDMVLAGVASRRERS